MYISDVTVNEIDEWEANARHITGLVLETAPEELDVVVAGEWSPRQILAHLLDSEIVFSTRLRAALSDPGSAVSPFDPDVLAAELPFKTIPIHLLGEAFLSLRATNTELMKVLPPPAWDQGIEHPERGHQRLREIARVFGDHFASHLPELVAARARQE